jgi:hypothetical protein
MTPDEKALLDDINRTVGRIEGRLQTFIEEHKQTHRTIDDRLESLTDRSNSGNSSRMMRWEGGRQLAAWLLGSAGVLSLIILQVLILISKK